MSPRYALRRLAQVLLAVAGIITITFFVVHAAPGDPVVALAGEGADEQYVETLRAKFGLDRPLPQQYLAYAGNVLRGDLGRSLIGGRPVSEVIGERLSATLLLLVTAIFISTTVGLVLGVMVARRPFGLLDTAVTTTCLVGYATPVFWLAQVAVLLLGFRAGLFPVQGMTDARELYTGFDHIRDVAHHLVLPAGVLAFSELALVARLTRTSLIQELGKDYVRVARSVGVSRGRVLRVHALRNALLPVVTIVGTRVGTVFSGAVLVESVFAWPGLGQLLISSTRSRDYPVLLGLVLLASFGVVLANLVTDFAYSRIDPRIRYE
ncbi:MAG: ABC transporter permease [Actinomycetota bacterium]